MPPLRDPSLKQDFFIYNTGPIVFNAIGQTLFGQINIQADADFWWTHCMAQSTDLFTTATANFLPLENFQAIITDTGQQKQLMDISTPLSAFAGQANFPFELPWRHRFPRAGAISWSFQNNTTLAANTLRVAFLGYKEGPNVQN